MKRQFSLFVILISVCLMLSCKKSSPTTPTPPTPPTIAEVAVTSEHSTVVVGNTEQMTATVRMSDAYFASWAENPCVGGSIPSLAIPFYLSRATGRSEA